MFGTYVSCAIFVFPLFLLFHFLSWAHSFFAFFHEALWRCSPQCNFSKTGLLEKCVCKYTLLNPARARWCPFCVRYVPYASCTRSDCPVHVHLLSVNHLETFCLLNWTVRCIFVTCTFQPFHVRYMYVRSFGFSTGLTFLPLITKILIRFMFGGSIRSSVTGALNCCWIIWK